jgi:hypothetical protein
MSSDNRGAGFSSLLKGAINKFSGIVWQAYPLLKIHLLFEI